MTGAYGAEVMQIIRKKTISGGISFELWVWGICPRYAGKISDVRKKLSYTVIPS